MIKEIGDTHKSGSPYKYTFTIFTPTYNRARTLHRVYESLKAQTFRDFEWLIIDDGSTDNTRELVKGWRRQADFPIRYFWQPNQGRHIAFNHGVQKAQGELFLPFDSDDACVPEALARLKYHWGSIPESKRDQFTGVTALCMDQGGRLVGTKFPRDVTDSDSLEIRYRYRVKGGKWGFHRTEVLKNFPFPAIRGVNYIKPGFIWRPIAREFRTRYVNETLHVYFRHERGRSDQLSKSGIKHAKGIVLGHRSFLNDDIRWLPFAPGQFLRRALYYTRFSLHAGTSILDQCKMLDNVWARILWAVMLPLGLLVYLRDKTNDIWHA